MDLKIFILIIATCFLTYLPQIIEAQHEDIPYQSVENGQICATCNCLSATDNNKRLHKVLSCVKKNFKHILARWPDEFGTNLNGMEIIATYSYNSIEILQQIPATNASLTFSCRNCGIKHLQAPTFVDVPNITHLDLSWNELTSLELTSDVFRGPYKSTRYEPISLSVLILSHNNLTTLDKRLFEHIPNLKVLDLSYNPFMTLDKSTIMALTTAVNLEDLNLAFTGISFLPEAIFRALTNLKHLNIAGNGLKIPPPGLQLIGKSLETLNLGDNRIEYLNEQSLLGLKVLKQLNISSMETLKKIDKGSFARLETLEYLYCSDNPKLGQFDLDSLTHCNNLTYLDISNNNLGSLSLELDLPHIIPNDKNVTNTTLPLPWPKLRNFDIAANPWECNCQLLEIVEYVGIKPTREDNVRCDTPYIFSGAPMSNFTAAQICSLKIPKRYRVVDEDPPRFLRKRYIILTAIIASIVIVIGLATGFVIVCIRRRMKRDEFGVEPIRYTSVRSSNLSALSHGQTNGNANA